MLAEHQMGIGVGGKIMPFIDDPPDRLLILRLDETDAGREERTFHSFLFQRIEDRDDAVEVLEIAAVVFAVVRGENQIDIFLVRIHPPDDTDVVLDEYRCFRCSLLAAACHQRKRSHDGCQDQEREVFHSISEVSQFAKQLQIN